MEKLKKIFKVAIDCALGVIIPLVSVFIFMIQYHTKARFIYFSFDAIIFVFVFFPALLPHKYASKDFWYTDKYRYIICSIILVLSVIIIYPFRELFFVSLKGLLGLN